MNSEKRQVFAVFHIFQSDKLRYNVRKHEFGKENGMGNKYEALFTPFSIGKCEIRNRVIIPAMEGTNRPYR